MSEPSNYAVGLIPLTQVLQTKFIVEFSLSFKKTWVKSRLFTRHMRPHPQSHTLKSAKSAWPILKIMFIFLHKYIPRGTRNNLLYRETEISCLGFRTSWNSITVHWFNEDRICQYNVGDSYLTHAPLVKVRNMYNDTFPIATVYTIEIWNRKIASF